MTEKLRRLVSSLTDAEIDTQIKDILNWSATYKELLEAEQLYRRNNCRISPNSQLFNNAETYDESDYYVDHESDDGLDYESDDGLDYESDDDVEPVAADTDGMSVDYEWAEMIQRRVARFSVEETVEYLNQLKQISTSGLYQNELSKLQFEFDTCELHYLELTGETPDGMQICPCCGTALEPGAKLCGKCGKLID